MTKTMTKTITVAQSLIYKKRVIEAINQIQKDIRDHNSVMVIKENNDEKTRYIDRKDFDIRSLIKRRYVLKTHLVNLKLGMWEASELIRVKILKIAESKSDIQFWESLDTEHGVSKDRRYGIEDTSECDAVIKQPEARETVKKLKTFIDNTQQEIDKFNYTTEFEIEDIGEL